MGILKKHIKKKPKKRTTKNKKTLPRSSNFLAKRSKKKLKKNSKNKTKQKNLKQKHLQKKQTNQKSKQKQKPKNKSFQKKPKKKRKHHPAFTPLKMAEVHNLTKIITSLYSDEKNDKNPKTKKFSDKTTLTKIYISSHFYIIYM